MPTITSEEKSPPDEIQHAEAEEWQDPSQESEERVVEEEQRNDTDEVEERSTGEDERIEETQDIRRDERRAKRLRKVSFADTQSISRIEVQTERKAKPRDRRTGLRARKKQKISVVPKNGPSSADGLSDKDVYIIKDNRNNQLYLTLKDVDGKFIMLKRQSGKKKRGYHPVWWKYKDLRNKSKGFPQKSQKVAPGEDWRLWRCSPESVTVKEARGRILSKDFQLRAEDDQHFLEQAGKMM